MVINDQVSEISAQNSTAIQQAQSELGAPQERHFDKKEILLKAESGNLVSTLALKEKWNEEEQRYEDPVPAYSLYVTDDIIEERDGKQRISKAYHIVQLPSVTPDVFLKLSQHFADLAKAVEGVEIGRQRASEVNDLNSAVAKLQKFKVAPKKK